MRGNVVRTHIAMCISFLGAACLTGAAHATPVTNANATIGAAGGFCGAEAHYTFDQGGSGAADGPNPFLCGWSVNPIGAGATSAQLVTTQSGAGGASLSFDLSNGSVSGSILSVPGHGGGRDTATIRDTVTFNNANPDAVLLGIDWRIEGSSSLDFLSPGSCCLDVTFQGVFGGVVDYQFHEDVHNGITVNSTHASGFSSSTSTPGTGNDIGSTTRSLFLLNPGLTEVPFQVSLDMAGGYGSLEFGHTFQVSLDLPAGVTYTSDSGVFLTAQPPGPPAGVPEPTSLALAGAGLALLFVRRAGVRR